MTRHHVTIHCNGETRSAMLTSDEIEMLWSYAKGLCLPLTEIFIRDESGELIRWACHDSRNLTFPSGLPETTGQGVK